MMMYTLQSVPHLLLVFFFFAGEIRTTRASFLILQQSTGSQHENYIPNYRKNHGELSTDRYIYIGYVQIHVPYFCR